MLGTRFALIAAACCSAVLAFGAAAPEPPGLSLGVALAATAVPEGLPASVPEHPMVVRLTANWADVETSPGIFDWSSVAPALGALSARGARVMLCVRGESAFHPRDTGERSAPDGAWLAAWTELMRSAVRELGREIAVVEVGEYPERSFDAPAYAFVLKSSALAIKAEAKAGGIDIRVAQGGVGSDALVWQTELWKNDAAPYTDILPIRFAAGAGIARGVATFAAEAAQHPPAAEIAAEIDADDADPWSSYRGAVVALASSAATALVALPGDAAQAATIVRAVAPLQVRLAEEYAPAPLGGLALRSPSGGPAEGATVVGRFLHAKDFATIVVYQAPTTGDPEAQARLLLDTINVKDPEILDLATGASYKTGAVPVPGEKGKALRVLLADHPLAAVWARAVNEPGLEASPEDVKVATTRGLTAEEIIAKNRQVQKIQDDHLGRWMAKGRAHIHFKLAQGGGSVDVGIDSRYFWQRGMPLTWQQTRYFLNGNAITWKKIPELPLIQPEKVLTLPLDLTFDKTYDYKLDGEDVVEHRPAYVVGFSPAAELAGKSLYRGRVWIDKESFVRLRTSVVQTSLAAPVLQNEETDTYVPVSGPDGISYTLIGRIDGQQLWSGWGRNFVVRRELDFSDFEINASEEHFTSALNDASASDDQMLQDTDRGFRYLKKQPGGARVLEDKVKSDALFGLVGALKDDSTSGVLPLIGVNWLDTDFLKKKIQFNVFFAVVYAYVNLTDPSVRGTKVDLGVEASLFAIPLDDKTFVDGTEDVAQRLRRRSQYLTGRVGYPLGNFFKLAVMADVAWNAYYGSSDARDALAEQNAVNGTSLSFVPPSDHEVYSGTLQFEFNRKGYSITTAGTASRRSRWTQWGLFDNATGAFVDPNFDAAQKSFQDWKLTMFKEWYLPKFQKLKAEIDYLDGSNLDRFSQYGFGRFGGASLVGFAGTGVRFDTGYLASTGWGFNILNAVSFNLYASFAHVKDSLEDDRFRNHTGAGFSFNLVGPWKTVWQGAYGRAIASDVPGLVGKQEFQVLVFKLF